MLLFPHLFPWQTVPHSGPNKCEQSEQCKSENFFLLFIHIFFTCIADICDLQRWQKQCFLWSSHKNVFVDFIRILQCFYLNTAANQMVSLYCANIHTYFLEDKFFVKINIIVYDLQSTSLGTKKHDKVPKANLFRYLQN